MEDHAGQYAFPDIRFHEGTPHQQCSVGQGQEDRTLVADLERKFQCKIQATVRIVPELIGGVRIAVGDEVIDASVRGKLAAMATALKN